MADIELPPTHGRTYVGEEARELIESMRVRVVGKPSKSLLDYVLFAIGMSVCAIAPLPYSVVGVVALLLVVVRR